MELKTKHFGVIDIDEELIIKFSEGLPGFRNVKKFILLGKEDEESPFLWLQGIDDTNLAFVLIDPYLIMPGYDIDIDDREVEILEIQDVKKVLIYCIVVIPEDIKKMSANLKAPVLINTENNRGKQVILEKGDYNVRHYILEGLKKSRRT